MNPQKQSFLLMKKYFGTKGIFIQQQKNIYLIPIKLYVYLLAIIDFLCYINTSLNMEDKSKFISIQMLTIKLTELSLISQIK